MERAKRLLRETDLPVIEVAAETGWSSLAHFTTTFRRRVGQTPSGYRAAGATVEAA
jgi:AraC-like DNA-binding protein